MLMGRPAEKWLVERQRQIELGLAARESADETVSFPACRDALAVLNQLHDSAFIGLLPGKQAD